jgi:hypothetical protein
MELLIDERRENAEGAVKRALRQMQNDAIALQLGRHHISSQYAGHRLSEILRDEIDAEREKFIQNLLHEIDNCAFERDKLELKNRGLRREISAHSVETFTETKQLEQIRELLSGRIRHLQQAHLKAMHRFEKAIAASEIRLANSRPLFRKTKPVMNSLSADLSDLRAEVSLVTVQSIRVFRTVMGPVNDFVIDAISSQKEAIERKGSRKITAREAAVAKATSLCYALGESLHSFAAFVNALAGKSVPRRVYAGKGELLHELLNSVIAAEEKAVVLKQIGGKGDIQFVQVWQADYQKILQEKENELEAAIEEARKKRMKLEVELDAALEQIRMLQGSQNMGGTSEFEPSQSNFERSTRKLDETMSQLRLKAGRR